MSVLGPNKLPERLEDLGRSENSQAQTLQFHVHSNNPSFGSGVPLLIDFSANGKGVAFFSFSPFGSGFCWVVWVDLDWIELDGSGDTPGTPPNLEARFLEASERVSFGRGLSVEGQRTGRPSLFFFFSSKAPPLPSTQ